MNTKNNRLTAFALTAVMGTAMLVPAVAQASEEGRKNTMLGLGAASAALLLTQKNKLPGLIAGGGALYAGSLWQKDINNRHKRERAQAYRTGFRRGNSYARYHRRHR